MNRSSRRTLLALAATASTGLAAAPATAQMAHIAENDWRQPDRHDVITRNAGKAAFAFEVRFGPYLPNVDSEFGGKSTPFADTFGYDCDTGKVGTVSHRLSFGLELDALPIRIPYLGMFGVGFGWGYTSFNNYAKLSDGPTGAPTSTTSSTTTGSTGSTATTTKLGYCAQQSTTLTIMPMHGSFVLRVDELMRRTGIPIVPYGKAGAGFSFWRASTEGGTEHCNSDSSSKAARTQCTADHTGIGISPTLHFALGGMIALNFIDPRASARLDETTGVHHAYVFGEWYSDTIPLSSNILRVGNSSWVAGIAVDL